MMENRLFRTLAEVMAVAAVAYGWWLRTNKGSRWDVDSGIETAHRIAA
jgi:hypothetical protein